MTTPAQIRAARALLGLSQQDVAQRAGVSTRTIVNLENRDRQPIAATVKAVTAALVEAGVIFIPAEGGEGPGLRLARPPGP
jgi:transcriptional regulator with XRE-family HTH domain